MIDIQTEPMKNFLAYTKERLKNNIREANEDIIRENRLIKLLCEDKHMIPRRCAEFMTEKYNYDLNGSDIINMFKSFPISQADRNEMLEVADTLGKLFVHALKTARAEDYKSFFIKRKESVSNWHRTKGRMQERITCMKLCVLLPELGKVDRDEVAENLGFALSKRYLYDIVDALAVYCGAKDNYSQQNLKNGHPSESDAYKNEIEELRTALERSDMTLRDLQDEFDGRLEESKVKELIDFFSQLNSEKYGCILDELLNLRRGESVLKKQGYKLPPEISGLLIMTKKLTQFVMDCGINPIMRPQEIKLVKAADIEFCDYDGQPFATKDTQKKVKVISPGWIYSGKDIQIARPKVKEVVDDE